MASDSKPYQKESVLREMYVEQEKSTEEIGEELDCNCGTVSYWLDKHDIETRKPGKRVEYANYRENQSGDGLQAGYYIWETRNPDGGSDKMYVHRLVAIAKYGTEDDKSSIEIADELGVSSTTVLDRLHEYDVL